MLIYCLKLHFECLCLLFCIQCVRCAVNFCLLLIQNSTDKINKLQRRDDDGKNILIRFFCRLGYNNVVCRTALVVDGRQYIINAHL